MSFFSLWRKLSGQSVDRSAPVSGRRATRRASSRKARLLVESLEDRFAPAVFTVTVPGDPLTPTTGTLRWAITQANGTPGSTIKFAINDSVLLSPTPVGNGELDISAPTTINGAGFTVTVDGQNLVRDFDIAKFTPGAPPTLTPVGVSVNFQNMTIKNGLAVSGNGAASPPNGGGILAASPASNVTLLNVNLLNNNAPSGSGAGVWTDGSLGIYSSDVDGNVAGLNGGGAWAQRMMVIDSSTISDNTATNGGGVYEAGVTPVVITSGTSQTLFLDNTANGNGGGAYANFNLTANGANFNGNTATAGNGGAIYSANGNVTITNNTLVSQNFASGNGGGIWAHRNITTITSWVTANQAFGSGGGLYSEDGNVTVNGGAVGLLSAASVGPSITLPAGLVFGGNTAGDTTATTSDSDGGGIFSGADVFVNSCAFIEGNVATGDGGGIFSDDGVVEITMAFVDNNTAGGNGGGINAGSGEVILNGAFIYSNDAAGNTGTGTGNGGGVYLLNGTLAAQYTVIFLNDASGNGGGIYGGGASAINIYVPVIVDRNTANGGGGGIFIGAAGVLTVEPVGSSILELGTAVLPPTTCNPTIVPYITAYTSGMLTNISLISDPNTFIVSNNNAGAGTLGGGGGGIDAEMSEGVTLLNTWVFGNTASGSSSAAGVGTNGDGGGVLLHNVLYSQISYSTFNSNISKSADGGGLAAILDRGSGTSSLNSVSVDDSTFGGTATAPNKAVVGGAVYLRGVDAVFNHVTFNDNAVNNRLGPGGVDIFADQRANAFLENVLADDTNGLAHGAALLAFGSLMPSTTPGVITSMGHNLTSDNSLMNVVNYNPFNGDIANGVQGLTPLGFHGGFTPTYDLVAGGQAIGGGDLLGPILDQDNNNRPVGTPSDIGAVQHH